MTTEMKQDQVHDIEVMLDDSIVKKSSSSKLFSWKDVGLTGKREHIIKHQLEKANLIKSFSKASVARFKRVN